MKELRACRKCHLITELTKCPECGGDTVLEWRGIVIVINAQASQIAKSMNVTKNESYAIKVR